MSYAPRSPDLSGIPPSPDLASAQYAPRSPDLSALPDHDVPPLAQPVYGQAPPYSTQGAYLSVPGVPSMPPYTQQFPPNPIADVASPSAVPIKRPRNVASTDDFDYSPQPAGAKPGRGRGRGGKKAKTEEQPEEEFTKPAPGEVEGIKVTTRFPVARIKRIMQHDEDVGKVSQTTPMAVSKALELFMISFVLRSANMAQAKGSKKVTVAHMKEVIRSDEILDFLSEKSDKYPDAPAAKAKKGKKDTPEDGSDE